MLQHRLETQNIFYRHELHALQTVNNTLNAKLKARKITTKKDNNIWKQIILLRGYLRLNGYFMSNKTIEFIWKYLYKKDSKAHSKILRYHINASDKMLMLMENDLKYSSSSVFIGCIEFYLTFIPNEDSHSQLSLNAMFHNENISKIRAHIKTYFKEFGYEYEITTTMFTHDTVNCCSPESVPFIQFVTLKDGLNIECEISILQIFNKNGKNIDKKHWENILSYKSLNKMQKNRYSMFRVIKKHHLKKCVRSCSIVINNTEIYISISKGTVNSFIQVCREELNNTIFDMAFCIKVGKFKFAGVLYSDKWRSKYFHLPMNLEELYLVLVECEIYVMNIRNKNGIKIMNTFENDLFEYGTEFNYNCNINNNDTNKIKMILNNSNNNSIYNDKTKKMDILKLGNKHLRDQIAIQNKNWKNRIQTIKHNNYQMYCKIYRNIWIK